MRHYAQQSDNNRHYKLESQKIDKTDKKYCKRDYKPLKQFSPFIQIILNRCLQN